MGNGNDDIQNDDAGGGGEQKPVSLIGEDGMLVENWMELAEVDENLRGDTTLQNTKTIKSMASQLVNAQKLIGKSANMVVIPGENATEAEWNEFFSKTGRPDTKDDYTIGHHEDIGEIDEALEAGFRELAHAEGLRPSTVQKLIDLDDKRILAIREAQRATELKEKEDTEAALKAKWGAAYDERLHLANRMVNDNTEEGEPREKILDKIGNDPIIADFLANIAKKFVEHKVIEADVTQPTNAEALAKIEELRATPGYITGELSNTSPARYRQITEEIAALYRKIYPAGKSAGG